MRRLRTKIVALAIGSLFCTTVLLSIHEIVTLRREIEYEFDLRRLVLTRTLMHLASEALAAGRISLVADFMDALASDPDVEEAHVLDAKGRPVASRVRDQGAAAAPLRPDPELLAKALASFTPQSRVVDEGGRYKVVYQRVWAETPRGIKTLGACVLKMSYYRQDRKIRRVILLDLALILGFTLVVLAAAYFFSVHITRPLEQLRAAAERIRGGDFDAPLPPGREDEIGVLAGSFASMIQGLKEREFMRNTFGKYVSPEVFALILRGGVRFGGERRQVSLLVADIRNFTRISESQAPERVMALLNAYFERMVEVVRSHGGVVDQFMGDAMLTVFGAPVSAEDHAVKAVRAALAMREELARMNEEALRRGDERLEIGIAVHTGDAVAGNLGSPERMSYTVIGDAVNLVSRMESLNKRFGTDILVSERTRQALPDGEFRLKSLGEVAVRGRRAPVELHQLLGRTA